MSSTSYRIENILFFLDRVMRMIPGRFAVACTAGIALGLGLAIHPTMVAAETPSLDGSWSGGGSVSFPSGAKESARCRANFKKRGAEKYLVSARCASASGKVEQSAMLTYVGGNRFTGSFYNTDFNVDGTITVTVSGNSQSVSISSPAGSSAYFRLSR
jgi:hypothetical protein